MPANADEFSLIDQLSTGVAVLDERDVLIHANPALIDATGITGWRDRPLATLEFATPELAVLPERARREGVRIALRGVELRTSGTPLRCDIAVSPLPNGAIVEVHALAPHESAGMSPRISQSLRGLAHEIKNPLGGFARRRAASAATHRRSRSAASGRDGHHRGGPARQSRRPLPAARRQTALEQRQSA